MAKKNEKEKPQMEPVPQSGGPEPARTWPEVDRRSHPIGGRRPTDGDAELALQSAYDKGRLDQREDDGQVVASLQEELGRARNTVAGLRESAKSAAAGSGAPSKAAMLWIVRQLAADLANCPAQFRHEVERVVADVEAQCH